MQSPRSLPVKIKKLLGAKLYQKNKQILTNTKRKNMPQKQILAYEYVTTSDPRVTQVDSVIKQL
jgi:hypothetical protein